MKVLVAGWIGSTNLGDELAFAGLRRQLTQRGVQVAAVSIDPARTRRWHGTGTVDHRDLRGLVFAERSADALVFGGGGILQDVTSPLNLPYHLSRVVLARGLRTPFAGVGLGVGGVDTRSGAALIRHGMRGNVGITVRDHASRDLLARVGIPGAQVSADLAFALDPPAPRSAHEVIAVSLRPWSERISRLPAATHSDRTPEAHVETTASALDEIARRTGLGIRFVALQRDRDDAFHRRLAKRMRTPVTFAAPDLDGFLDAYADAQAVISMRYHGGVGAVLAGRPVVLVSYALKVDSLALELGAGAQRLGWDVAELAGLPDALDAVIGQDEQIHQARAYLRERQGLNGELLDRLLEAAAERR